MTKESANPWYREPWPWIVMAGPAIVVVAGTVTAFIAMRTSDGLVADDYYRQGLAINRVLAREERARALGIQASVQMNETRDRVRVLVRGGEPGAAPRLTFVHATRAGLDRKVALTAVAPGVYDGIFDAAAAGPWHVHLEDEQGTWRLDGEWRGAEASLALVPAVP